jgi:cation transport protein ChaC
MLRMPHRPVSQREPICQRLFRRAMKKTPDQEDGDLWVFAYGSLIWSPGFPHAERIPARMNGVHRSLCVLSFVHRGTPEKPGLVLGLDRGGACRGIAYRVEAKHRAETIAYLRKREQATMIYREVFRTAWLETPKPRPVSALVYLADRGHKQYAGRLTLEAQLHLVNQGHGVSGPNRDYVIETVKAMEALGFREGDLHRLAAMLRKAPSPTHSPAH